MKPRPTLASDVTISCRTLKIGLLGKDNLLPTQERALLQSHLLQLSTYARARLTPHVFAACQLQQRTLSGYRAIDYNEFYLVGQSEIWLSEGIHRYRGSRH